jgi:hypothetical protein
VLERKDAIKTKWTVLYVIPVYAACRVATSVVMWFITTGFVQLKLLSCSRICFTDLKDQVIKMSRAVL